MKKLFALILLLLVAFLVVNRNRVYLRDPLATVTRNGLVVHGARVLINYSNDVLLDQTGVAGGGQIYLLQHWNQALSTPAAALKCIYAVACLTDADHAAAQVVPVAKSASGTPPAGVTMSNRQLTFADEQGAAMVVTLR